MSGVLVFFLIRSARGTSIDKAVQYSSEMQLFSWLTPSESFHVLST